MYFFFFFFNDTATTEIYTLSLHDALPISLKFSTALTCVVFLVCSFFGATGLVFGQGTDLGTIRGTVTDSTGAVIPGDRKSTRLNSSHLVISYAVFCLKKKKNTLLVTCSRT